MKMHGPAFSRHSVYRLANRALIPLSNLSHRRVFYVCVCVCVVDLITLASGAACIGQHEGRIP